MVLLLMMMMMMMIVLMIMVIDEDKNGRTDFFGAQDKKGTKKRGTVIRKGVRLIKKEFFISPSNL